MTSKVVLVFASARESLALFRRLLDAVTSGLTWEIQCGGTMCCCTDLIIVDWDFWITFAPMIVLKTEWLINENTCRNRFDDDDAHDILSFAARAPLFSMWPSLLS